MFFNFWLIFRTILIFSNFYPIFDDFQSFFFSYHRSIFTHFLENFPDFKTILAFFYPFYQIFILLSVIFNDFWPIFPIFSALFRDFQSIFYPFYPLMSILYFIFDDFQRFFSCCRSFLAHHSTFYVIYDQFYARFTHVCQTFIPIMYVF